MQGRERKAVFTRVVCFLGTGKRGHKWTAARLPAARECGTAVQGNDIDRKHISRSTIREV